MVPNVRADYQVSNFDLHQIAAAQLAVDRELEERFVPEAPFAIEMEADRPDLLLR